MHGSRSSTIFCRFPLNHLYKHFARTGSFFMEYLVPEFTIQIFRMSCMDGCSFRISYRPDKQGHQVSILYERLPLIRSCFLASPYSECRDYYTSANFKLSFGDLHDIRQHPFVMAACPLNRRSRFHHKRLQCAGNPFAAGSKSRVFSNLKSPVESDIVHNHPRHGNAQWMNLECVLHYVT